MIEHRVRALLRAFLLIQATLAAAGDVSLAAEARTGPTEKLILGFENGELGRTQFVGREVKRGRDSWFYLIERPGGFDFSARFEWPTETNTFWTWSCRSGEHTEGEMALAVGIGPANPYGQKFTFLRSEFLSRYYPSVWRSLEARPLMTTFQWLSKGRPDLKDWSGYDVLRVNVRCQGQPAKIWLAVEDDVVEPPLMRLYELPANKWVTLELDLAEAVKTRGVDLKRITNFWLMGTSPKAAELRIDNVRITRKETPVPNDVLRDESPMAVTIPPRPQRPAGPTLGKDASPDRSPVTLDKPITVTRGSITPFGWVAAYDNRRIFVAYNTTNTTTGAVYTDDGGKTWKQLPAATASNLDHGSAGGCAIDAHGDGLAVSTGPGCIGCLPGPKQHVTKYTFTGAGWEARLPARILDCDIRHCGHNGSAVRLSRRPFQGRIWAGWGEMDRSHASGVHVKFSDDDGETWFTWGKGGLLPGSRDGDWSNNTYGYPNVVMVPYRHHVACIWQHIGGPVQWSFYDGSAWSASQEICKIARKGDYGEGMSAVTTANDEIYVAGTGIDTVMRWDGKAWFAELIAVEDGGMLSLAGDVVMLFTSGKLNRRWTGANWSRKTALRSYRRTSVGKWEGPVALTGEFNIHDYRGKPGFSVPSCSPPNFVPLVWSDYDEKAVKLIRVPVAAERTLRVIAEPPIEASR